MNHSLSSLFAACPLNFTAYPYEPTGECLGVEDKISGWNSLPTTRCCRNALTTLSQALALQANATNAIFLSEDQWKNCHGSFLRQNTSSSNSCNFQNLHSGSSKCSNFSLSAIEHRKDYQDALHDCSQFNSSFDETCKNCTQSIIRARDHLLEEFNVQKNHTERAICGVAVVISVAAGKIGDHSLVDDLYRCLHALDKFGKEITTWSGLYRFSKTEIENAINHRIGKVTLGAGSVGQVYKGVLPSGQAVAIKHIYKRNHSHESFTREVEVRDCVLSWDTRVKILRDCALALRYLHNYIDGCIVHRDIKLTNILLTEKMEPKLSDFGLTKILGLETRVYRDVRGMVGYMDPECMITGALTCASDIYNFGIVILQMLSGMKVIDMDHDARDQLSRKAKEVTMGKRPLEEFKDPRLKENVSVVDFESILLVAVLCVAKSSKGRPTINVVFEEMDKAWKNTSANMSGKEMNASATPQSKSMEAISV
ncbi:hypothetical protein HHK36_022248 [Tetracentron sinense]|uniref:non-specific serine/threonine protein kinase n=1 Tax=Tetracentron sinense TaxID=13715 RepID=A0A835D5X6_TETSI|nr:hypothetical protein HHK36_022248 [Tetracentron sinense]